VNDKCTIEERFADFINTKEKTGVGLAEEITKKIQSDGLKLCDILGQGYDNGSNMSGKYNGVQALISEKNVLARCVPYAAHTLNLVGVQAESISVDMVSFFGTIQRLFTFFSSSTQQWNILMNSLEVSLKAHSSTRWCSKACAVRAVKQQLPNVFQALYPIVNDASNADTLSVAQGLLSQMFHIDFVAKLVFWDNILTITDDITVALQSKKTSLVRATKLLEGLKSALGALRQNIIHESISESLSIASGLSIDTNFSSRQSKGRKIQGQEEIDGEMQFRMNIVEVTDSLLSQIQCRFESMCEISSEFSFLHGDTLYSQSVDDLKKSAVRFACKYKDDASEVELSSEIESFKYFVASAAPNFNDTEPISLLNLIHQLNVCDTYPNIESALRIFSRYQLRWLLLNAVLVYSD
jgi:hypothetical protein